VAAAPASAEEIVVTVTGSEQVSGEIACRLYSGPRNFPYKAGTAGEARVVRRADGAACTFTNIPPGNYALVVALLPKGQEDITRDLLGRPKQPWGVSNNVRFSTRAPRYDEAAFVVASGKVTRVAIRLAR
jgi:uncharacterized protein (DUF2141 family)